jgi:signal transduction histidine kinase
MTRAELARRDDDNDHFQHVENALDRMERIIEKTLSLARQGQTVDATEPVSLRRVAEESWSGVETSGWHLDVVDDTTIYADSDRLRNVFENLYRNAVEHGSTSSDSQAPLRVRVGVLDDGFYVEDTGVGIPPDEREQVFELGYSADAEGTGFGLAIVREIVEAHGWDIGVTESNDVSPEEHRESGTGAGEMSSPGTRFEITGVKSE